MKQREKNASQPATNNTFKNTQTPNTLKWLGVYAKKWVYQPFCNILFCKSRTKIANAKSGRASISMARHMEMDGIQQQTNRRKKNVCVCVLQQVKKIFFVSVFELASGNQFLSHMGSSAVFFPSSTFALQLTDLNSDAFLNWRYKSWPFFFDCTNRAAAAWSRPIPNRTFWLPDGIYFGLYYMLSLRQPNGLGRRMPVCSVYVCTLPQETLFSIKCWWNARLLVIRVWNFSK